MRFTYSEDAASGQSKSVTRSPTRGSDSGNNIDTSLMDTITKIDPDVTAAAIKADAMVNRVEEDGDNAENVLQDLEVDEGKHC